MITFTRITGTILALSLVWFAPPGRAADLPGFDIAQYRGKVVLLDFWASWCAPCLESFPWMQSVHERYASRGLVVVAVNVDHERDAADRFLRARNASFAVVFDREGALAERFHVASMPQSFYIDRAGTVRYVHNGFHGRDRVDAERELLALVNEP